MAIPIDFFPIAQHDTSPMLDYALTPETVDLTDAMVVFIMKDHDMNVVISGVPATILIEKENPTVRYEWVVGDTISPGTFYGEFVVTYANGKVGTFPNRGYIIIKIKPKP